jgi:oligopeptide transport system substrate-binding protein
MKSRRIFIWPLISFVFLTLLMAVGSNDVLRAQSSPSGGTLFLAENSDIRSLDPSQAGDGVTMRAAQFLGSRLLRYTGKMNNELIGALAESWRWTPDGKSVTFKLRKNLLFSDGSPLTSDDVAFTFTRLLNPKTKSPYQGTYTIIKGAKDFIDGKAGSVSGIVVIDPENIRFDVERAAPYFLNLVTLPTAGIVSRKAVEKYGDTFSENPVAAGPWILEKWTRGQELVLARNKNYYQAGLPKIDRVNVKLGIADNLQVMMFQRGELDMVGPISSADYLKVESDPKLKSCYYSHVGPKLYYIGMNVEVTPFNNKLVRQALNYGVDKEKLLKLENGRAEMMRGVTPPWVPGFDASIQPYPYDPEKAKQLLTQAGYPNGFELDMLVPDYRDLPQIAASAQADLSKIGVKLNLRQQSYAVFRQAIKERGKAAIFPLQWATDFPDAQNVLSTVLKGSMSGQQNFTWYNNPNVNTLLDQADGMMDPKKRSDLYQQADKIVHEEAPWIFCFYLKADALKSTQLRDTPDSFGRVPAEVTQYDHFDGVAKVSN